ncbi:hypothetical protein BGZ46_005613, partial [Entomortierella lignicola]
DDDDELDVEHIDVDDVVDDAVDDDVDLDVHEDEEDAVVDDVVKSDASPLDVLAYYSRLDHTIEIDSEAELDYGVGSVVVVVVVDDEMQLLVSLLLLLPSFDDAMPFEVP